MCTQDAVSAEPDERDYGQEDPWLGRLDGEEKPEA